jgi:hypothetical protein
MLGGLQLRSLHRDLVDTKKMTDREFHDRILHEHEIPIDMMRALLTTQPLSRDYKAQWRFYELPGGKSQGSRNRTATNPSDHANTTADPGMLLLRSP